MNSTCVVLITAPAGREARKIARVLLDKKLCACVNIVPRVDSFFRWKGKMDTARESLLVIKTERRRLAALVAAVKRIHSYEVCEIIALPIVGGNKAYLEWVSASCRKG